MYLTRTQKKRKENKTGPNDFTYCNKISIDIVDRIPRISVGPKTITGNNRFGWIKTPIKGTKIPTTSSV